MRDNKGEFTFQQIIALVLVIALVISVAIFLFRVEIIKYVRLLPGYQMPENSNDVDTDTSSDENANAQNTLCPINVGSINGGVIYINGEKTNLIWKGSEIEGKIIYDGPRRWYGYVAFWLNGDKDVAEIKNRFIESFDFKEGTIDSKIIAQLENLDGAKRIIGNKLCKGVSE